MQDTLKMLLGELYELTPAGNAAEAIKALATRKFDIVLLDLILPDMDGIELLGTIKREYPDLVVVVVTAHRDAATAVKAMKAGAYDYIEKPFDRDNFLITVGRAVEKACLCRQVQDLRLDIQGIRGFRKIVGRSPQMIKVFDLVEQLKDQNINVLLTGESGTGKEMVAPRCTILASVALARSWQSTARVLT